MNLVSRQAKEPCNHGIDKPELNGKHKLRFDSKSILFQGSLESNFIYEIESADLTDVEIDEINSINTRSKIKDRINRIDFYSGSLKFVSTEKRMFGNNLTLIDSFLPQLVAEVVRIFYSTTQSRISVVVN